MNTKRIRDAAYLRGMVFVPFKNKQGFYEIYDGERFQKADTLDGIYKIVMSKKKVR